MGERKGETWWWRRGVGVEEWRRANTGEKREGKMEKD